MKTIHAWDCLRCATRNAPSFVRCRHCDGPQSQGRPVAGDEAPVFIPYRAAAERRSWPLEPFLWLAFLLFVAFWLFWSPRETFVAIGAVVGLVASLPGPSFAVLLILLYLRHIARGVARLNQ